MSEQATSELVKFSRGLEQLGGRWWATDFGFARALNQNNGAGEYLQAQKSSLVLWDLLTVLDPENLALTLAYFELPADTLEYVKWMYGRVSYQSPHALPAGTDQYEVVDHYQLYQLYSGPARRHAGILVHGTGGITTGEGIILVSGPQR